MRGFDGNACLLRQQQAILRISDCINRRAPLAAVMDATQRAVADSFDAADVKVIALRQDAERSAPDSGFSLDMHRRVQDDVGDISRGAPTANEVLAVEDLRVEDPFRKQLGASGIHGGLGSVIFGNSDPFCVIGMHRRDGRALGQDARNFLKAVVNLLSLAVRLHEIEARLGKEEWLLGMVADHVHAWRINGPRGDGRAPTAGHDEVRASGLVEVGCLKVDLLKRLVSVDGRAVELPPMEAALLVELVLQPGQPIPAEELGRRAWPQSPHATADDVRRHIYRLRRSLGDQHRQPPLIRNRRGFGYALEDRPSAVA